MSSTLLTFNPEAYGSGGDRLLFGVTVPSPSRPDVLPELEELNLASHFLEAKSNSELTDLVKHIIHCAGVARRQPLDPPVAAALLPRLSRSGAVVRSALRSANAGTGSARSPEVIFGTELEGLSPEDQEFETARRFVRFAYETASAAAASPGALPDVVAAKAEHLAAHHLAPGLSRAIASPPMDFRARRRARLGR
jgi:hypothetical protein